MTLEIIVFILSILFGIMIYWRESKNNKLYRFFNKLTHSKDLQMKPDDKKGFVHRQAFLMRLVWITLCFVLVIGIISAVTPFQLFYLEYFASAVVGTLIGTYIASGFLMANKKMRKENLEKAIQKGKDFIEDFADGDEGEEARQEAEPQAEEKPATEEPPKKSARDRLKDKGMIN